MKNKDFVPFNPNHLSREHRSRHRLGYNPNLLLTESVTSKGQVWVGDITTFHAKCRFCYLAVLMDLYSRRIVGWHINQDMTEELVAVALRGD